jgi:hypothetical protein
MWDISQLLVSDSIGERLAVIYRWERLWPEGGMDKGDVAYFTIFTNFKVYFSFN